MISIYLSSRELKIVQAWHVSVSMFLNSPLPPGERGEVHERRHDLLTTLLKGKDSRGDFMKLIDATICLNSALRVPSRKKK